MSSSPHLSAEELDYLRRLFGERRPEPEQGASGRDLLLDPSGADAQMLMRLIGADSLKVTAEHGGYRLQFELRLEQPSSGEPVAVRLGYPTILDRDGQERAARVHPQEGEVLVTDPGGRLRSPAVTDISASGMAIADTATGLKRRGRDRIGLRLRLDGGGPIEVEGRVVRANRVANRRRMLGIAFEHTDSETRDILNRFIFRHHPLARS